MIFETLKPIPVKSIKRFAQPVASKLPASSALAKPPSADLRVSSAADAFQSLSLNDPRPDANDLIGSFAKLSAKEWIPYSAPPPVQPKQSPVFDDLTSAFASLSTSDNTLERPCAAVDNLTSSFAKVSFSTIDNTFDDSVLEEPEVDMDNIFVPFRKLSIKDHQLRASARLSHPSRQIPKQVPEPEPTPEFAAPEIDDLVACMATLSYEERTGLRSCFKDPSRPHPGSKSVNFVTYEGRPDVDMCELRYYTLRKGEERGHKYYKRSRPHVPGDKYIGTENDGTTWLAKTLGLFHPPGRRGNLGKLDRW
ncbi:uncharacterized protein PAC_15437 [Phialocephala subalpina]|uniref:Uncharacterized protein n=1 Tax=Phialocephala subalpina TaxID=576137 RepID=A0A1L7XKS1_9HELO|nr:uncharacterized protein PAC_15437 [Phialocephala subalpina]